MMPANVFATWRDEARRRVEDGIAPDAASWSGGGLFDSLPRAAPDVSQSVRVPAAFLPLAETVFMHRSKERFDLLYRLLWRLQIDRDLLDDPTDCDVVEAALLAKAVRRDIHKMRAFVRFRQVQNEGGDPHYVAWFEPDHLIVAANAGFFVRRFAQMRWSILTPDLCLHWDGEECAELPGIARPAGMTGDPAEDLWCSYYSSTFNPARLKTKAMLKEMPRRYWRNLPEAQLIPGLIAGAQAREAAMIAIGAAPPSPKVETRADLRAAVDGCTRCPIHCHATQAVHGEGPGDAPIIIIGEQPGDHEDLSGRPFVGPAGKLLDSALAAAAIDRGAAYLTNAVKHFKHERRGNIRLHKSPTAGEIDHCRWWLDAERRLIRPRTIIALGASAARGVLGKTVNVTQARQAPIALPDGSALHVTFHPAHILRLPPEHQAAAHADFVRDLALARR